jgi:hypothetical protein
MPTKESPLFDFNDLSQFDRLVRHLYALRGRGLHRVEIVKVRAQRSLKQQGYYWAVVLPYAAKGFREAWGAERDQHGREINSMWAHEFFKARFLAQEQVDPRTGEVLAIVPGSSAEQDTAEFAEYLNHIIAFCADYLGVEIPEAVRYIEPPPRTMDDGPPDESADRAAERIAGTPEVFE